MPRVYRPELSAKVGIQVYSNKIKHGGYARPWENSVTLRQGLCDILESPGVNVQTADALWVLCHEMGHCLGGDPPGTGTNDEWKANQYSFSHFKLVARRLGFSRWQARKLYKLCQWGNY